MLIKTDNYTGMPCHTWCGTPCNCYPFRALDLDSIIELNLEKSFNKKLNHVNINESILNA